MTELYDTIDLMVSQDYQKRFIAEYRQLVIRYEKLKDIIRKYEAGELSFRPASSLDTLKRQLDVMGEYLALLEKRAEEEHVNLEG